MHLGQFGGFVFTHAFAAASQLPLQPVNRPVQRIAKCIAGAMCDNAVTAGQKNARFDLLGAVIIVEFDNNVVETWFKALQLLNSLFRFRTSSFGYAAMTSGNANLHAQPPSQWCIGRLNDLKDVHVHVHVYVDGGLPATTGSKSKPGFR
jgi:hypothetical protein